MKFPLIGTLLLIAASAYAHDENWQAHSPWYIWKGVEKAPAAPEGLLRGNAYNPLFSPEGKAFTYTETYEEGAGSRVRTLKKATTIRNTRATNPTGSPDIHGQHMEITRRCAEGNTKILRKVFKYPNTFAAPYIYFQKSASSSTAAQMGLIDEPASQSSSDFISEDSRQEENSIHQSRAFLCIFKGYVTAPKSMTFRFVGAADDTIIVNFNDKPVLETGYYMPTMYRTNGLKDKAFTLAKRPDYQADLVRNKVPGKKDYILLRLKSTPHINNEYGGLTGGTPITVEEGQVYPIEIILLNGGGHSHFYLLTQEVTPSNTSPLHLFRTADELPESKIYGAPSFEENSLIWKTAAPVLKKNKKSKRKR